MPAAENDPASPCPCGSGKAYANCHQEIFDGPNDQLLQRAHDEYAASWAGNADHYRSQGLYAWLAEELASHGEMRRVLDIGCGRGHGLEALRVALPDDGRLLIGVDENPACLEAANALLGLATAPSAIRRMASEAVAEGQYRVRLIPGALTLSGDVVLANVDLLLKDQTFESCLDDVGPLDAIALWFSGIHKARASSELAGVFEIRSDADHRELVEDATVQLAAKRLRGGGLLHIVSRGANVSGSTCREEFVQTVNDLFAEEPFEIVTVGARSYTEPEKGPLVSVRSKHFDARTLIKAVVSVVARRI